jgi:adenosylcobinamide kinase/adenosylcobinamide-phosphate guanylyltransferase
MSKITFVLGGARSGKSRFALEIAKKYNSKKTAFVATSEALDKEMGERIAIHKKTRPKEWKTFEEPILVSLILRKIVNKYEVIILDCLTLFVSNLLLKDYKETEIEEEINKILSIFKSTNVKVIIVSNEVGLGIVPENKLAREFRDIAGRVNQIVAKKSNDVHFMISGIPWRIK